MKADSSRKKLYEAKNHEKKALLHVHLSKELRLKSKKRSILVMKGDKVRVMRGGMKGKEGKIAEVDYNRVIVFVEGLNMKNARGKETPLPLQPSNLLLVDANMAGSRKELFGAKSEKAEKAATAPKVEVAAKKSE
jgi:large subunit ribosomal protein L24